MEPESGGRSGFSLRGSAGLIIAVVVVAILLIAFPSYRWFFLISVLIGLVIAGGLALWHRLHPMADQDVQPKRPLGLYLVLPLGRPPGLTTPLHSFPPLNTADKFVGP